jgi:Rrf2 family iron-sulfur cluster assembly transcriptional regulator
MRLSTKGRYAVMAMADLAGHAPESSDQSNNQSNAQSKPVALADIAERQDISLSYLEQLFAKLRRGGLVTSVRGPGGGYRLARPSDELRIADIIVAVDEPIAATRCKPNGSQGCTKTGARCVTHDLWEELGQQIHVFLSSVSLADVVERRVLGRSRPCNDFEGTASEGAAADFEAA